MITVIRTKDYLYLYFLGAEAQARCPADELRPPERDAAAGLQEQGIRIFYLFYLFILFIYLFILFIYLFIYLKPQNYK